MMRVRTLTLDEARVRGEQYFYVLAYEISRMHFGNTRDIADKLNWQELIDARFFDSSGEVHVYNDGEGLKAYEVSETEKETTTSPGDAKTGETASGTARTEAADTTLDRPAADIVDTEFDLAERFRKVGSAIVVREYLSYDEDGQAAVELKRLAGVTGRER